MNVACHVIASQSERLLDGPFTAAQILKVSSYALVLGGALLDNAQLFEQVRHLAVTDSLTGLANYRTLINVLESEMQRSRPYRTTLFHFASGFRRPQTGERSARPSGGEPGDLPPRQCASRSFARDGYRGAIRRRRICAGIAGSNCEAASSVSRRIRERLANDGEFPTITVSAGAAVFPRDGETIDGLFNFADRELYSMKGKSKGIHTLARIAACL